MASEATEARAGEICAHLLIFPYLSRDKYKDLLLDEDLRESVARRLDAVGMQLAASFYSEPFAVRWISVTNCWSSLSGWPNCGVACPAT